MAAQQKTKKTIKKQFFEMVAPLTASKILLYGNSMEEMNGKMVMVDLTRSLRGKNLILKVRVKFENGKLVGELKSLELAGVYIRRMIRKGIDYVEDSFVVDCKDKNIIIKPFLITRNKVSRAVRKSLRDSTKEFLVSYVQSRDVKELFSEIMTNKIQKVLALKLKKIYPLALCEIRWFEVLGNPVGKIEERVVEEQKKITREKIEDGGQEKVVEEKGIKKETKAIEEKTEVKVGDNVEVKEEPKKEKKERKKKESQEVKKEE